MTALALLIKDSTLALENEIRKIEWPGAAGHSNKTGLQLPSQSFFPEGSMSLLHFHWLSVVGVVGWMDHLGHSRVGATHSAFALE